MFIKILKLAFKYFIWNVFTGTMVFIALNVIIAIKLAQHFSPKEDQVICLVYFLGLGVLEAIIVGFIEYCRNSFNKEETKELLNEVD